MRPRRRILILVSLLSAVIVAALLAPAWAAGTKHPSPQPPPAASPQAPPSSERPEPPEPPEPAEPPDVHVHEGPLGTRIDIGESHQNTTMFGDIAVPAGTVRDGDVVVMFGRAKVDGTVNGDVVVIMGSLEMSGTVSGEVVGVMSRMDVNDGAVVLGNLVNVGGRLHRGESTVRGDFVNVGLGHLMPGWGGFVFLWFKVAELLTVFLLVLILAALVPERIRLVSEEMPLRWGVAILAGIGGYICLVLVLVFLGITIIGIPIAILVWFVFVILKCLALAGVFDRVGRSLGRLAGREMSLLGAVMLGFLPFAILRFIPCFGALVWMVLQVIAVGLLILTRGGGRRRVAHVAPPFAPPPIPPPAPPPMQPTMPPSTPPEAVGGP